MQVRPGSICFYALLGVAPSLKLSSRFTGTHADDLTASVRIESDSPD